MPLQAEEFTLPRALRFGMSYDEALRLCGSHAENEDSGDGWKSFQCEGYRYVFYDDTLSFVYIRSVDDGGNMDPTTPIFREKMQTFKYGILPFALILVVICGLVALERHFSCILIMLALGAVMMFLGGVRLRWFIIGGVAVAAFAAIYLARMGYAGDRVTAWRDPASDPTDTGYQILQSLYAIGSGGLMGLGLGKGRQKYLYLPEEHNDYIFPIVCEELGFIGAMVVILLFVLLILRGYWIAMHARDRFGALMTAGLTTHLALQVFLNIGVVTNFLPATGISLPFFSYGGTALLIQLFEMGLILAVSRQNDNKLL